MKYYVKIWLVYFKNSLLGWSINRPVLLIFLLGKVIRYIAYFGFLYFLITGGGGLFGYNKNQTLLFTATFVLIDTISQFFFRHVYSFRQLVVTGDLDLILVKPTNTLFRVLLGAPDPIDFVTIPPIIFVVIYLADSLNPNILYTIYYILLVVNGLLISAALHIFVLGFGVITTEVDHMIMVYRDVSSMGRFPVDIYGKNLGAFLTFVIPIGIMVTVPVKVLTGTIGPVYVFASMIFGCLLLVGSIKFWNFALKKYTSASS